MGEGRGLGCEGKCFSPGWAKGTRPSRLGEARQGPSPTQVSQVSAGVLFLTLCWL